MPARDLSRNEREAARGEQGRLAITEDLNADEGKSDPFAAAVRATRMPMIITDPHQADNPIIFANDAFLTMTGYGREEVNGRNCRFLQGPETSREDVARVRRAVDAVTDISVDLLNYRKDGTPFWNALYISPVSNEAGELRYFFASQLDVSERKQYESGIIQDKVRFERAVSERTADLEAANARLASALAVKDALLHEVDHRVKNNMQIVASLIGCSCAASTTRVCAPRCSRPWGGRGDEHGAPAVLPVRRRHALRHRRLRARARHQPRRRDGPPGHRPRPRHRADRDRGGEGGPPRPDAQRVGDQRDSSTASRTARGGRLGMAIRRAGDRCRIVVADDGPGLAKGTRTTGPRTTGTYGRQLVTRLGRQLQAAIAWQDAGPGLRVEVDLPSTRSGAVSEPMSAPPLNVLIVEDEGVLAMNLEFTLEAAGHSVAGWATCLKEAEELSGQTRADLALVDIHLTDGITGLDVARLLQRTMTPAILFMTANPRLIPVDFLGAVGVIAKPYTEAGLLAALRFVQQGILAPPPTLTLPIGLTLAPPSRRSGRSEGGARRAVRRPAREAVLQARTVAVPRPTEPPAGAPHLAKYRAPSGWGTWIRTTTNGVRVRCSTVKLFPTGDHDLPGRCPARCPRARIGVAILAPGAG